MSNGINHSANTFDCGCTHDPRFEYIRFFAPGSRNTREGHVCYPIQQDLKPSSNSTLVYELNVPGFYEYHLDKYNIYLLKWGYWGEPRRSEVHIRRDLCELLEMNIEGEVGADLNTMRRHQYALEWEIEIINVIRLHQYYAYRYFYDRYEVFDPKFEENHPVVYTCSKNLDTRNEDASVEF